MDKFLASYIETALWSSTGDNGEPLDSSDYSDIELADETIAKMSADCIKFEKAARGLFDAYDDTSDDSPLRFADFPVAHDFWLTRNRHGAGFWDGDYPKPLGEQLTELAQSFGECNLYIGDDKKFYIE